MSTLGAGRGHLSPEEYAEQLRDDFVREEAEGSSASEDGVTTPPRDRRLVSNLQDLPVDSERSDSPGFLGDQSPGETEEESQDSESNGELSNLNSAEEHDDFDDEYDEVPNPPPLPQASEDRLQDAWPLGDQSFTIFLCPITHEVMTDPVVSADGHTYEREAIWRWFQTSRKSPVTGQTLPHTELVPNQSVRTLLKTLIDMTEVTAQKNGGRRQ
jgi:hypothetical protein